jgi:hypothetical protein
LSTFMTLNAIRIKSVGRMNSALHQVRNIPRIEVIQRLRRLTAFAPVGLNVFGHRRPRFPHTSLRAASPVVVLLRGCRP